MQREPRGMGFPAATQLQRGLAVHQLVSSLTHGFPRGVLSKSRAPLSTPAGFFERLGYLGIIYTLITSNKTSSDTLG